MSVRPRGWLPVPYLMELLAWVPVLLSAFAALSFLRALDREELRRRGFDLRPEWEAGVIVGKEVYRWLLLDRHLFLFGCCAASLLSFVVVLVLVHRRIAAEISGDGAPGRRRHAIANGIVLLIVMTVGNAIYFGLARALT